MWISITALMLLSTAAMAAGTQYCEKTLTSGGNSIKLTCEKVGGVPTMTIEGTSLNGLGGSFFYPNGSTGSTDLRNRITSSTSTKIVISFNQSGDTNPQLHTPLYVLMPGEVNFGNPSPIDWDAVCTAPVDPTITVNPTSLKFSSTGSKNVTVTASNLTSDISASSSSANFVADVSGLTQAGGTMSVTCSATANENATITLTSGTAQAVVNVSYSANTECAGTSSEASQQSFTTGYNYKFSTTGTSVNIEFEMLDNVSGLVAYLWNETSGFQELGMTVSGKKATYTLTGQTIGSKIKVRCKFAYAGGMAVTKQYSYTVGNDCQPKITTDVSESIFTAKDQVNTITVTGSNLSSAVTYAVSADKFQVTESTLTSAGGTVKVKYVSAESSANETITFSSGTATPVVVALKAQASNPTITVDKTDLTVMSGTPQKFTITAQDLTETVAISCTNADFSFSPSVGAQTGSTEITVSYNGTEKGATGVVTLSSEGATSKNVNLKGYHNTECSGFSNAASQGSFTTGYNYDFSTSGTSVKIEFELLDAKDGVVAYLWDYTSGFAETGMAMTGKKGSITLTNKTVGSTLSFGCKFGYTGGMAVTKTFTYVVGHTCTPTIFVDKDEMTFEAIGVPQTLTVTSEALTEGISIAVDGDFTATPTSLGTSGGSVQVSYTGAESSAIGSLTLTSAGATAKVVNLTMQLPTPKIFIDKSAMTFISTSSTPAAAQTLTVSGEFLNEVISISSDNDAFTVNPATAPQSGAETEISVSFTGTENETGTLTLTSQDAETKTVSLAGYYNTACSGYLVATGTKDIPLTYSISETTNGQVVIEFTFAESVTGISPQIYFEDTNIFRTMTSKGGTSYTLTTDDQAVTASPFKYKGYFPIPGGVSQTSNVTYTKGSCDVYMVRIGGKSYTTLAAALDDYTTGSTIEILGDINESNSIEEYVKFNANNHSIGNITVGTSGKLEFMTNGASIGTLIVQSVPNVGAGQIVTNNNTITATEAYLERQVYSGSYQQYWYSFGVPFTVDARNGVYSSAGSKLSYGTYYIQKYDGAKRAEYGAVKYGQTGYAWSEVETLEKGVGYMIYIASQGINTLRFKATTPSEVFSTLDVEPVMATKYTGSAAAADQAWNFMAQPRMQNAELQSAGPAWGGEILVQVLNNGGNDEGEDSGASFYSTASSATLIMSPFTTFMFQPSATGALNFLYNSSAEPTVKSAEAEEYKYFIVELSDAAGNSDNLFASASEDASEDGYQIGRDLVKSGSSDANLQICAEEFGLVLTANDARAYDGVAEMALRISAPKAGNYSIKVTRAASSGEIYLTKNGAVVADLTEGDAYQFAAPKGVSKQYGLRIELDEDFATSASDADAEAVSVYAQGGTIYVNGAVATDVLNILGQSVVNPVAASGVYLVNAGGKYVKINVE